MVRKALKTVTWIFGGLIGLVVLGYVVTLAVNWRDQPPSADALRLAASYEARPPLPDDDNAFVYLLGLDAPLSDNPRDVGARRLAWLVSSTGTPLRSEDDPQTEHLGYLSTDPVVERFLDVCRDDSRDCANAFADAGMVFQAWNATHPWLLDRYLALISHSGWREEIVDVAAPLPNYATALHGQRVLLLQAKVFADNGDTRAATALLASDARFWRTVLASSDLLISKMVATAALRNHFAWGSLVVRNFPSASVATDIPDQWREPMTDDELSLRRALVGEWIFFSKITSALAPADFVPEAAFPTRIADSLLRPLFQPQDTLNRHAALLDELAVMLDVPLRDYVTAADRASQLARQKTEESFPPRSLYNIVGSLALAASSSEYSAYAYRVGDLEGMRRAALAAVLLGSTPSSDRAGALATSPLRNPYDDQPLHWDATDEAVVFVGLEPRGRGEHRYYL